jgi:hypothetical protein
LTAAYVVIAERVMVIFTFQAKMIYELKGNVVECDDVVK